MDMMNTQSSSSSAGLSSISTSAKYRGMIEESGYKKSRNALFILFDYFAEQSHTYYAMHEIISVLRILQIIGPAFAVSYQNFWGDGTTMKKAVDIISIIFHLIPGFAREDCADIVLIIYFVIFIIVFIAIFASALYLSIESKLPKPFVLIATVFFSTAGYLLHPIALNLAGELTGIMINNKEKATPFNIVSVVLSIVVFIVYLWLYHSIYAVSITFKPDSLMASVPIVSTEIFLSNILITYITGCAAHLSKIPCLVLTVVAVLIDILEIRAVFGNGGLVNFTHVKAIAASFTCGALMFVCVIVFTLLDKSANEIVFIICIALWIACFVFFNFFLNLKVRKVSQILDLIETDEDNIDIIRTPRQCCDVIVNGFRIAHPVCLSYKIFKHAIEVWPKHVEIWLLYAKFSAIYPEYQQQMTYVQMGIVQNKLKGALAKHTLQQIATVLKQREPNLIPALKSKLDKVNKQVAATKHKIRYIWEIVLQGNVHELETVISHAYRSIQHCEAEFTHFLNQFPNNRFVARAYSRFLRDVIGNQAEHKIWANNVSALQRGLTIKPDQAHELGLHAFPLLPRKVDVQMVQAQIGVGGGLTEDTLTQEIGDEDEQSAIDSEIRNNILESINKLNIPAYRIGRILRVISIFILFMIPVIVLCIFMPIFVDDMSQSLNFMYDISLLRTRAFQVCAMGYHYIGENLKLKFDDDMNYSGVHVFPFLPGEAVEADPSIEALPEYLGSSYNTKVQVDYLIQSLTDTLPSLTALNTFEMDNEQMDLVRDWVFGKRISFEYISNPVYRDGMNMTQILVSTDPDDISYEARIENVSIRESVSELIILLRELIQEENVPPDALAQKYVSIPLNNIASITNGMSASLQAIRDYIATHDKSTAKIIQIIMIVVIIVAVITFIVFDVVICILTSKEKLVVYRCLTSLPKNIVSKIADSFKVLKKDEDEEIQSSSISKNEEVNRQEENLLKIFSTSSDSHKSQASDAIYFSILTFFIAGIHVVITVCLCLFMMNITEQLTDAAPHIDFIMSSYGYDLAAVLLIHMLGAQSHPYVAYHTYGFDVPRIINTVSEWQELGILCYQAVRYGSTDLNAIPFASLGIDITDYLSNHNCTEEVPHGVHQVYNCWSADLLIAYEQTELQQMLNQFRQEGKLFNATNSYYLQHIWHIHQVHIFNNYFAPMFKFIISEIVDSMKLDIPTYTGLSIGLMVFAIILEIAFIVLLNASEEKQRFALRLLLHSPGEMLTCNSYIMGVLSGHFAQKHEDSTQRHSDFYNVLVRELPDSVIITDLTGSIKTINKATERIYHIDTSELINTPIINMIEPMLKASQSIKVDGTPEPAGKNPFENLYQDAAESLGFEIEFDFVTSDGNRVFVNSIVNVAGDSVIISTRDVTQTVNYNQLISDERAKSDYLLSSILPKKLVPRVQAGEKNISFAVQSATIVFMDIVSFTPWCGSLPAQTVMKTLNRMFKENDALVAAHTTMTKIKCIGDCYMAAGGIFAEVNQPAQHSKDVVEFGLDAIDALLAIDEEIGEKLQIRVGVNTGGPIVAGVLGTDKPTFEILGPTINMAQQMEHHGVPMKVHVTRAVYELIYGGNFDVKERGEVAIKGGTVVTYLVKRDH